jgi:hypothetical protein
MASSAEHAQLYGKLRASLLARHFAFSRYFRVNYLSLDNSLGALHRVYPPSTAPPPRTIST